MPTATRTDYARLIAAITHYRYMVIHVEDVTDEADRTQGAVEHGLDRKLDVHEVKPFEDWRARALDALGEAREALFREIRSKRDGTVLGVRYEGHVYLCPAVDDCPDYPLFVAHDDQFLDLDATD